MVKASLSKLLKNKMMREIKSNFKQFLALILIATLAVTLYVGLSANARSLKERVNKLYESGNVADIFVYTTDVNDEDFDNLLLISGVDQVEKRFSLDECIIYHNSGTLMIAPDDNTLCVPSELIGSKGVVVDSMFASLSKEIKIGKPIKIGLPYSIQDFLSSSSFGEEILAISDGFLINPEYNPLREKLTFYPEVTGLMKHPETVEREFSHGTCLLDQSVFDDLFHQMFIDNFQPCVAEAFYQEFKDISIYDQYLIKVRSGYDINEVNDRIYQYFNPSSVEDNSYLISSKFWGEYRGNDSNNTPYVLKINKNKIVLNSKQYEITRVRDCYYEIKLINGEEKFVLNFSEDKVELLTARYQSLLFLDRIENTSFVASLTKDKLPSNATMEQDIYQAQQLCIVFPVIFFVVAALVLLTSLSQTIYRSRQEIGTLKALGIPNHRILIHYISLGAVLSLIGTVLGSILGPLIITPIMNIKYSILYNLPAMKIIYPFSSILFCIGGFLILAIIVTFGVTISEVKLNPVSSMRPKANVNFKDRKLNDHKQVSTFSLSLRMAFRNIFSKKSRMFMVIFGVMGCTALTVAGFGILDTIYYGLNIDLYETYNADLTISYANDKQTEAYEILINDDEVELTQQTQTKVLRVQGNNSSKDIYLNLFERKENYASYSFLNEINQGVAIANSIANELGIKVGDEINLIYLGQSYKTTFEYGFESSYWLGIYGFSDSFIGMNFSPSGCFVKLREGVNPDSYTQKIMANQTQDNKIFSSSHSLVSLQKLIDDTISSVKLMCNTVKIFAVLLAVVVTYNLAALNFTERKRDISTLKVLGFNSFEIGLSLVFELLFLTIVGLIFGLILGYPLLYLVMSINETSLLHYIYHISFSTYAISVLISLGTSIAVNTYLGFLASKVDAVSALKSVE